MATKRKPLKILSASAGSGKTYNLVRTYMRFILGRKEPVHFQSVLAMTFTNKAATEMKERIIDALNMLSNADELGPKALRYLNETAADLEQDPLDVQQKARTVLRQILHQYEHFSVLTIDKFNLRLIRSFARDLNINSDFQTSINEKVVLGELVDQLFDNINRQQQEQLTELSLKYARENLEEGLKWDFKNRLKEMALVLTREHHLEMIRQLMQQDLSLHSYRLLREQIGGIETQTKTKAAEVYQIASAYDMDQFPGKSTSRNAFEKLRAENLFEAKNPEFFTPSFLQKLQNGTKGNEFPADVVAASLHFSEQYAGLYERYHLLELYRKNYFNLAILQLLARALEAYKQSDHIILISEFNKLISELLQQEDAAYIYERIGSRYSYFLLDEFQDTSRLQWINLIPLVHDSLANGKENLIVGDPKQSIYRFKNGMAEQFVALPGIYNPESNPVLALKSRYFEEAGELLTLSDNWRSRQEIVQFNNAFFEHFRTAYPGLLQEFYKDLNQHPKGLPGGYVWLESKPEGQLDDQDDDEHNDDGLEDWSFVYAWIEQVLQDGYDPGDICLLGYQRHQCNQWAEFLSSKGLKVVSADSLLLGSDVEVALIISYFSWRNNPTGLVEARMFAEQWFYRKQQDVVAAMKSCQKRIETDRGELTIFAPELFIQQEFGSSDVFFAPYETLSHLFAACCRLTGINELQNPYVHQLADFTFAFDQHSGPDLALFLENYRQEGKMIPVQIPENREAIKIMTGHKSKGLEFPVVMVPSLRWDVLNQQAKMLLQQDQYFFYLSPSVSSPLAVVREAYEKEFAQALMDKINLNYVLFTRPQDRLYIRNTYRLKKKAGCYDQLFHQVLSTFPGVTENEGSLRLEFGQRTQMERSREAEKELDLFVPVNAGEHLWFPEISIQDRELLTPEAISEQQRFGTGLHELLASITDDTELDNAIDFLYQQGRLDWSQRESLKAKASEILQFSPYVDLFRNAQQVLREQSLIASDHQVFRPDLLIFKMDEVLVLDYKTGLRQGEHARQVQQYCKVLKDMGYKEVKGMVLYTSTLELEWVSE